MPRNKGRRRRERARSRDDRARPHDADEFDDSADAEHGELGESLTSARASSRRTHHSPAVPGAGSRTCSSRNAAARAARVGRAARPRAGFCCARASAVHEQAPSQRHAAGLSYRSDLDREALALAAGKCLRSHQDPANQSPAAVADGKELGTRRLALRTWSCRRTMHPRTPTTIQTW
jgi:hypothetical protein